MADGANAPLQGSDANRKPDLVLLPEDIAKSSRPLDWRDVSAIGEMKSNKTSNTVKSSYIEAAGKTALLLYAQDGQHSAPCVRLLGQHIILTFFDRGGSLSTAPLDINKYPDEFLRILIALSRAPLCDIGFDETVISHADGRKRFLVAWTGALVGSEVIVDNLLFISDAIHRHGTTVWGAQMHSPGKPPRQIVVKDSWIDPLRKFTEGTILAKLNKAGVKGVPKLIHEQQVQGPHPLRLDSKVNQSTHFLRTLLSRTVKVPSYHVRVLSRVLMEPVGQRIFDFSSLAELLVVFIDYVLSRPRCILCLSPADSTFST